MENLLNVTFVGEIKECLEEGRKRFSLTLDTTDEQLIATGELYRVTISLTFLTAVPVYNCFSGMSINDALSILKSPNSDDMQSH